MNSVLQKIGFPKRVDKVTKKLCRERIRILKDKIIGGKYRGQNLHYARYYLSKYRWMLKCLDNKKAA